MNVAGTRPIGLLHLRINVASSIRPAYNVVCYVDKDSYSEPIMKTIQMTLEEELLREVDRTVKRLGTSRSGLIRASLRQYLKVLNDRVLEDRHREGYRRYPARNGEFDVWEAEQEWGD